MKRLWFILGISAGLGVIGVHATEGVNLIGIGPIQQGTAGAGVASARDSSWLILNPAGLTDVGRRLDASFQYFAPTRTLNSPLSGGAGRQTDDSGFVIPSVSLALGCCRKDNGYLGIGLYGTSGMGVDYNWGRIGAGATPESPPSEPQSAADRMTELAIVKLALTYAHAFDSGLSIGVGPLVVLSRFRTDMFNPMLTAQPGSWDTAYGGGVIVGLTQPVGKRLRLGASYMTEQFMSEFEDYDTLLADSLNLPPQLTLGLAFRIFAPLEAVLDYRWLGWNGLETFGSQFGWRDQHMIKFGLTWDITPKFTFRGGVSHGNSPIESEFVFANALFPAIMETHATAGISYGSDALSLHAAYVQGIEAEASDPATGTTVTMYQHSLTVGIGWTF